MSLRPEITIDSRTIGAGHPVYIIADMSANHGQDIVKARELVCAAHESGADAIKLQTYRADTLTMKCDKPHFYLSEGAWKGQYLYDLYDKAHMPWEFHGELFELSKKLGICCFSSPFDHKSVDLLEEFDAPAYKIASPEIIDHPLIARVAQTGKPVIISTGSATFQEIGDAVQLAMECGVTELALLKCTSAYPAPAESINLRTIQDLSETFLCPAGFSDHTIGNAVPLASVAMGACIIEKHLMLEGEGDTADSFFSMTPQDLAALVRDVRQVERALGRVSYPETTATWRRCLYAARDIAQGEIFSAKNVANLRPGGGEILPADMCQIIGRIANGPVERGEPLCWADVGDMASED